MLYSSNLYKLRFVNAVYLKWSITYEKFLVKIKQSHTQQDYKYLDTFGMNLCKYSSPFLTVSSDHNFTGKIIPCTDSFILTVTQFSFEQTRCF
jgi:hypothetical protein